MTDEYKGPTAGDVIQAGGVGCKAVFMTIAIVATVIFGGMGAIALFVIVLDKVF